MLEVAALAIALGLGAGLSPGPLFTFVVVASLRGGAKAGVQVAIAPLLTDPPIVALALTVLASIPDRAVTVMSIVGGVVVMGLGVQAVREARHPVDPEVVVRRTFWQGLLVNVLGPGPWVFWLGVGAPIVVSAWHDDGLAGAAAFLALFYVFFIGTKIVLAFVVAAARSRFSPRVAWWLGVVAGALMLASGVALVIGASLGG